jgi:phosphoglycolate phosphatase-like HAD superfamily hydrolase
MNIDDLIDCVACGDDVEHGKPDPRLVGLIRAAAMTM